MTRGTKIIIELKDECKDFSKNGKVRGSVVITYYRICVSANKRKMFLDIVQKMSNFVGFPIKINGDVVNNIQVMYFSFLLEYSMAHLTVPPRPCGRWMPKISPLKCMESFSASLAMSGQTQRY